MALRVHDRSQRHVQEEAIVAAGGFDENFEFYLEEPDLCLRLIERGFVIKPTSRGFVHHKFLASPIRNKARVTFDRSKVIVRRAYFAMRHGLRYRGEAEMCSNLDRFVAEHREDLVRSTGVGLVPASAVAEFDEATTRAIPRARRLSREPARTRPDHWFADRQTGFIPFPVNVRPGHKRKTCLVAPDYLPAHGVQPDRSARQLATELTAAGHVVYVIARTKDQDSEVRFEDGIWIHGLRSDGTPWSQQAQAEVRRIDATMGVDDIQISGLVDEELAL